MSSFLHKIKVGNQTSKVLTIVPNYLDPKPIPPHQYVEWDSFPAAVDVQVLAQDRAGQWVHLGTFNYSNLSHNYADIHVFDSSVKSQATEFYTLFYYLEGDTIHPFAFVEKAVWDSLRS